MTTVLNRYLNRREAAQYLSDRGFPTAWTTLQKLASIGGGPRYRIFGRVALYETPDLDTYAEAKLSAPRFSTSEAA